MSDLRERLLGGAVINWETGCWEWAGRLTRDGYGRVRIGQNKVTGAHRASYQMTYGPIPDGLVIDHLCRVRHCVNPAHMEAVTPRINTLRGVGLQAINAAKTVCDNGHEYTPENTYTTPDGRRDCRACIRVRVARYKARKQVAA